MGVLSSPADDFTQGERCWQTMTRFMRTQKTSQNNQNKQSGRATLCQDSETFNFDECFLILKSTTPSTILKRNVGESFSL